MLGEQTVDAKLMTYAVIIQLVINIYLLWRIDRLEDRILNFSGWRMWLADNFRSLVKEANRLNKEEITE